MVKKVLILTCDKCGAEIPRKEEFLNLDGEVYWGKIHKDGEYCIYDNHVKKEWLFCKKCGNDIMNSMGLSWLTAK